MNCGKCGAENPPEARFCGGCGAAISAGPVRPVPAPGPPDGHAWPPVDGGMKVGIILGSFFTWGLLGIVMGLVFMNDANPHKKAAGKLWLLVGICQVFLGCACVFIYGSMQSMNY